MKTELTDPHVVIKLSKDDLKSNKREET
jgi:hypothetical protein